MIRTVQTVRTMFGLSDRDYWLDEELGFRVNQFHLDEQPGHEAPQQTKTRLLINDLWNEICFLRSPNDELRETYLAKIAGAREHRIASIAAAQSDLDEARKRFEAQYVVHPVCGEVALAPTREKYIVICAGCIVSEGEKQPLHETAKAAIDAWEETANDYGKAAVLVRGPECTLYWRILPEIDEWGGKWKVYSRFLISDKSPQTGAPK